MTDRGAYRDALERLYGLVRFGEKLSLDGPRELEMVLGHPLDTYPSILIGGTNGKGSTCAFLEALLRSAGLKTGLFTSPHLMSLTERIRIDGQDISADWIGRHAPEVLKHAEGRGSSFFEAIWALAAVAFRQAAVDVAIWEVGLGGRLDATNVADPRVSAITSIGLDHTHILGPTLDDIAAEKCAIYREGAPALTAAHGDGLEALRTHAPDHLQVVEPRVDLPRLSLPGAHHERNASLALEVARAFGADCHVSGLSDVRWPGRGEIIDDVILDCAHNPHALKALGDWLHESESAPVHTIFGAMDGKDVAEMAQVVDSWSDSIVLVTPDYPRRLSADALAAYFPRDRVQIVHNVPQALSTRPADAVTLVCGSGFLVGEARAHLLGQPYPEYGIRTVAR